MALAYLTINLDAFTGDDHPPISQYSTITLDPGADHIDAAADVIHVRSVVVSLDQQGKAASANGVACVDGRVPIVAGVMYAVSAPNVLRDGPHYIPALTAGQVVDLSDCITPGAPLTRDQAAILTARIKALEATPPGGGGGGGGSLTYVTANTDIPNGTTPGQLVGYYNAAATSITVEGGTVAAGAYVILMWTGTAWQVLGTSGGGGTVTPTDTTPPTAGALSVSTTSTEANLSVAGALDDVALHATPYSFSKDAGATWTAWQAATTYKFTGLASSTSFTFQHKVRDAAGNVKIGTSVAASTPYAPTWVVLSRHDFEGVADNTLLNGLTPIVGTALNVQSTRDPFSTGTASTAAKVIGGAATTTAASGWTPDYSLYWSGLSGVRGVRATITYDFTGGASNNPPQVFLRLPLNSAMTNHISFGAEFGMTTPHVYRYGGSAHTSVVEATAPTFTNTGKVTVEATWAADGTGGIVKVFYNDELHTTYTLTGSTIFPDEMGIGHHTGAVGPASTKMLDYRLETTT
jgi:hypothetical protein